ncbi:MAG TPA: glycosyltransferase family 4 protein [Verrucomicrobiae bacterium]|jgi:glycosyltransferase involved in cell wall biosynthesis|nr:glycosyltransferase family 4 protein [Verrucomicrobiae bacterium]
MKLLVFAHTPPPHHGQSYMVQLMLEGLRQGQEIECFHVNARVSRDNEDIGGMRLGKMFLLLRYCAQAVWLRFRHGIKAFYYVPAPGKTSAVARDWVVMLLCRPFFPKLILHWHAAGLSQWLESKGAMTRILTHTLLGKSDLSILTSDMNRADAESFGAKKIVAVRNCLPDPCPDFETNMRPRREARLAARLKLQAGEKLSAQERAAAGGEPERVRVLFLAHCMREKGLFDTLDAVAQANAAWREQKAPWRMTLTVAGAFHSEEDRAEFERCTAAPEMKEMVQPLGFISGAQKQACLAESDVLCFPTYYHAEAQPLTVVESMAVGLPIVTTRWRSIPDILPPDYAGFVAPQAPAEVAQALRMAALANPFQALRARFLECFTVERHLRDLTAALRSVE